MSDVRQDEDSRPGPGLYVHIPFCAAVCPYCDFAVVKWSGPRRSRWVSHLLAEVEMVVAEAAPFDTVYFGGGTPSILAGEELEGILAALRRYLGVLPEAWIFLEANPEDATRDHLAAWRALGVQTLSLGVQSFDAGELAFLGRHHTPDEARRAVEWAREVGFETVSLDLIYGLPGQGPAAWRHNLATAVRLGPDHLSCYQLTVHEGTPFGYQRRRGELAEASDGEQAELFHLTHAFLADHGYPAYEVSNFAAHPRHRSRHNMKYWDHTPYLGLGPSAHSFDGKNRRWWNERKPAPYQRRLAAGRRPVAGEEILGSDELALEALMLALRTPEGVDLARFRRRYGVDLEAANASTLERLTAQGLLRADAGRLAPTRAGLAVADTLAAALTVEGTTLSG